MHGCLHQNEAELGACGPPIVASSSQLQGFSNCMCASHLQLFRCCYNLHFLSIFCPSWEQHDKNMLNTQKPNRHLSRFLTVKTARQKHDTHAEDLIFVIYCSPAITLTASSHFSFLISLFFFLSLRLPVWLISLQLSFNFTRFPKRNPKWTSLSLGLYVGNISHKSG